MTPEQVDSAIAQIEARYIYCCCGNRIETNGLAYWQHIDPSVACTDPRPSRFRG